MQGGPLWLSSWQADTSQFLRKGASPPYGRGRWSGVERAFRLCWRKTQKVQCSRATAGTYPSRQRRCASTAAQSGEMQGEGSPLQYTNEMACQAVYCRGGACPRPGNGCPGMCTFEYFSHSPAESLRSPTLSMLANNLPVQIPLPWANSTRPESKEACFSNIFI